MRQTFKTGDRVIYDSTGPDNGAKGTVTHVHGLRIEVTWDDGESYSYVTWGGSCIRKIGGAQ